jgi:hypothetical protein
MFHLQSQWSPETHLLPVRSVWKTWARKLRWEIVWRNAPRIWRDFGSPLTFQSRLTQRKSVLPLSNEHGSWVKDQGRRQCCHNKHKKFPYRPTRDVSLLSGDASYFWSMTTQTEKHDAIPTRHMNWTRATCIVLNITYCSNRERWHQCLLFNYVWCKFNTIPYCGNVAPGGEKIRHPNTSKHLYLMHFLFGKVWNMETVQELNSFINL